LTQAIMYLSTVPKEMFPHYLMKCRTCSSDWNYVVPQNVDGFDSSWLLCHKETSVL